MSGPRRTQLRRTKGWRKPAGAVVVSRPTRWGNPFAVGDVLPPDGTTVRDRAHAVELYRIWLADHPEVADAARRDLAGADLACWCPLAGPCHADVLLDAANHPEPAERLRTAARAGRATPRSARGAASCAAAR